MNYRKLTEGRDQCRGRTAYLEPFRVSVTFMQLRPNWERIDMHVRNHALTTLPSVVKCEICTPGRTTFRYHACIGLCKALAHSLLGNSSAFLASLQVEVDDFDTVEFSADVRMTSNPFAQL